MPADPDPLVGPSGRLQSINWDNFRFGVGGALARILDKRHRRQAWERAARAAATFAGFVSLSVQDTNYWEAELERQEYLEGAVASMNVSSGPGEVYRGDSSTRLASFLLAILANFAPYRFFINSL